MKTWPSLQRRRGAVLPLTALCLVALIGFLALAIDLGLVAISRSNTQNSADAAALAGVRTINGIPLTIADIAAGKTVGFGIDDVPDAAIRAAIQNPVLSRPIESGTYTKGDYYTKTKTVGSITQTYWTSKNSEQVTVETGAFVYSYDDNNPANEKFTVMIPRTDPDSQPWGAVRVTVTSHPNQYSFARIWGLQPWSMTAKATAVHRPRDVAIVYDLSASMRAGSHLTGERWDNRRHTSMNPDPDFPKFGHYADYHTTIQKVVSSGAENAAAGSTTTLYGSALQRLPNGPGVWNTGGTFQLSNNELVVPGNQTITGDSSGPPLPEDFYQDAAGVTPTVKAFTAKPTSYATAPAGDVPLKVNNNTGPAWAATVNAVFNTSGRKHTNFETNGYTNSVGPDLGNSTWYGYTEGPTYWGQTFFIWPPDPGSATLPCVPANYKNNGARDWRQRFFLKVNTSDSNAMSWLDDNNLLFDSNGMRAPGASISINGKNYFYRINYAAILYWLREYGSGTTVPRGPMPERVRAGRIRYYDSLPDPDNNLNNRFWTTATLSDESERFWRDYIDYVLGVQRTGTDAYTLQCNTHDTNKTGVACFFAPNTTDTTNNARQAPGNNTTGMAGWPSGTQLNPRPTPCSFLTGYVTTSGGALTGTPLASGLPAGTNINFRVTNSSGTTTSINPGATGFVIFGSPQTASYVYAISASGTGTFQLTTPLQSAVDMGTPVHFIGAAQNLVTANATFTATINQPTSGAGGVSGQTGYATNWNTLTPDNWIRLNNFNPSTFTPQPGDFFAVNGANNRYYSVHQYENHATDGPRIKLTQQWNEPATAGSGSTARVAHGVTCQFYRPTYIHYADNPKRPRMHYWFGPLTFVDFIGCENMGTDYLRWPGTLHEAPNWQAKVGVQAAIDDIKNNHPNDFVGLCYFNTPIRWSDPSNKGAGVTAQGQNNRPWVKLGKDYTKLKNALFYPLKVVNEEATEIGMYSSDIKDVPRAQNSTDTPMGMMLAYNMLSSASTNLRKYATPQPQYYGDAGGMGRRGARKMIIVMTDGLVNMASDAPMGGTGTECYFAIRIKNPANKNDTANEYPTNGKNAGATDTAEGDNAAQLYYITDRIVAQQTGGANSGLSLPNKPVLIHCLAYGSMFDATYTPASTQQQILNILQKVMYKGSVVTSTGYANFPSYYKITGTSAERKDKMQQAFTAIMQDGIQVSLYE